MSVAAHGPGPASTGGDTGPLGAVTTRAGTDPRPVRPGWAEPERGLGGPGWAETERGPAGPGWAEPEPGVRPRAGRVCPTPRFARRMDHRPGPRLRVLHPGRAAPVPAPTPEPRPPDGDLTTPAWTAALDAARSQVGPVALRVLAAVAEVLDGVRPVEHLAGVCPDETLTEVSAIVLAARRPGTRGTRVRGLRLCPLVTTGPHPVPAVEAAAALCTPGRPDPSSRSSRTRPSTGRARAVAARFELHDEAWRLTALVLG